MKDKYIYIAGLDECPVDDASCPYWDCEFQKCKMWNETNDRPSENCDAYSFYEEEEREEEE